MEEQILYYENRLQVIIWLLNHTNNEDVENHLLCDYYNTYEKYEEVLLKSEL